jgi:hypothetical protein
MTHHKQTINSLKLQNRILWTILVFSLVGVGLFLTREPVISPCPGSGCFVKTVYASEEKPETEKVIAYITEKFLPEGKQVVVQAINCFYSESGFNPRAVSPTNDHGVAQINLTYHTLKNPYDYKANIDKAYSIYKSSGWSAWYGKGCK